MNPVEILVSSSDMALEPAPIAPSWIIEGAPVARFRRLFGSRDGMSWTVVWDCTAGKFHWYYTCDETLHIMEGGVTLTDDTGTRRINAGDVVFFPAGSHAVWKVDDYIRKVAFMRRPVPTPVGTAIRAARKFGLIRMPKWASANGQAAASGAGAMMG